MVEKVQGIRSITGRYKIDRGMSRISPHTHTTHGCELRGGLLEGRGYQVEGGKRRKLGQL